MRKIRSISCGIWLFFVVFSQPLSVLATTNSLTKNTQADFDLGTYSNTQYRTLNDTTGVQLIAGGGPNGTRYRRPIVIDNTGYGSTLNNYVVSFNLDTATLIDQGKLQANCGDIRFRDSDNTTNITDLEITSCNSATTTIEVKVPSIPANSTKTIYLYYGSPTTLTTQSSSQANVTLAEDMNSAPAGTLKGSPTATYDSVNKYVQLTTNTGGQWGALEYEMNPGTDFDVSFEFWAGGGSGADATYFYVYGTSTPTHESFNTGGYVIYYSEFQSAIRIQYGGSNLASASQASMGNSQWHTARVVKTGQNFKVYYDGVLKIDYDDPTSRNISGNLLGWGARTGGANNYHRIRNLSLNGAAPSPAPTAEAGDESEALVVSGTWTSPDNDDVYELTDITDWGDGTDDTSAFSATVANASDDAEIEFELRTAATLEELTTASFTSIGSESSGTTFSATKANLLDLNIEPLPYVQLRTLLTSANNTSPALQSITFSYTTPTPPPPVTNNPTAPNPGAVPQQSMPAQPGCSDPAVVSTPDLFQIATTTTQATLYFAPIHSVSQYYISFSSNPSAEEHGADVSLASDGVQLFTVDHLSPGTTYYFRVRGQNGCSTGEWSRIVSATTTGGFSLAAEALPTVHPLASKPSPSPTATPTPSGTPVPELPPEPAEEPEPTHNVLIKVQNNGVPVANAQVELHSNPKYGTTNERGEVLFANVEKGEHTLKIAYNDYRAEQKLVVDGTEEHFNVSVNIELKQDRLLPTWGWLTVLGVVILGFLLLLIRKR